MKVLFLLCALPLGMLARGYALMKLWLWFVVPFGCQEIGFWHSLGLSALISLLTYDSTNQKQDEAGLKPIINSIFLPLVSLLFGYVYYLFMN